MNVRIKLGVVAASVAALALSACGSSSLSGEAGGGGSAPSVSVSQNADLASKLPESIKNAGVIKIGVDASYAPNEFLAGDGKTVQGMDVDLFNQVASKFGVKTEWHPADFGSIINGVNGKKYDMGISSFTINPERMKQVNMVSYFKAGTQWATAQGNPKGVDPENACGKNIAVQSNTVQEMEDLPARQKKCGSNKINVLSFKDQSQATAAVVSGKADAMLSDSPVVAYAVKLETRVSTMETRGASFTVARMDGLNERITVLEQKIDRNQSSIERIVETMTKNLSVNPLPGGRP